MLCLLSSNDDSKIWVLPKGCSVCPPKETSLTLHWLIQEHQCFINNCWYQKNPQPYLFCVFIYGAYSNYCMGRHISWENSIWSHTSNHRNCISSILEILILRITDKNTKNCNMDSSSLWAQLLLGWDKFINTKEIKSSESLNWII